MKTFTVDFYLFNKVLWKQCEYNITALSKEQLKDCVIDLLERGYCTDAEINESWLDIEKNIKEEELIFPIVVENIF